MVTSDTSIMHGTKLYEFHCSIDHDIHANEGNGMSKHMKSSTDISKLRMHV